MGESTAQSENKVTLQLIKDNMVDLLYQLSSMKFQDPWTKNAEEIGAVYAQLRADMTEVFNSLMD